MAVSDRNEALRELGHMARERREQASLSLEDIFERTRVRTEFLHGIEQGNYQGFPDLVYTKGFVRTYLGVIGADDLKDEFLAWLNKENAKEKERALPPTNVLGNTTPPTKGFKPASHFWLFVVLFLILIGTGAYVWYSWTTSPFSFTQIRNPRDLNSLAAALSGDQTSEDVLAPSSTDQNFLSILPVSASFRPEPEPETVKPSLFVQARNKDLWMKVTIGERTVFSKTLKSGEAVSWDLAARAQVTYGRPDAAFVVLNGKELGIANSRGSKKSETYIYEPDGTHRKVQ